MDIRTSPLVAMAGEAKRPTRWWFGWIVALAIIIAGAAIGQAIGNVVLGNPTEKDTVYQFNEFFSFGATLLLLFVWVRVKEGRAFSSVGFRGTNPVGKFLLGIVIGAVMMSIGVGITLAIGQYGTGLSVHTNLGSAALLPILGLLFVFFLQGSTEEAVTRGYMLQIAGHQLNASWVAVIGSSFIFAVIHPGISPLALVNIFLYALFASFVALGAGNLWLICGVHAGWNYFQGNIYGLPVSGNPEANSLLAIGPKAGSSTWLTGGDFGVEASVVGSAVLLVALVIAFAYFRRQQSRRTVAVSEPAEAVA